MGIETVPRVEMYVKGAATKVCSAWAYILVCGEHQKSGVGSSRQNSPNAAGLHAIVQGLKALKEPCDVTLITSSPHLIGGVAMLKNGVHYDTNAITWVNLADLMTRHILNACYSPVSDTPLLQDTYNLAVGEMCRAFGIDRELLGTAVKS